VVVEEAMIVLLFVFGSVSGSVRNTIEEKESDSFSVFEKQNDSLSGILMEKGIRNSRA
jgi:hypothetical protein